ncbi:MAG TPA: copper amine oxidase N-terminal domain-containing protein, partial [Armatimonadota bacterium]
MRFITGAVLTGALMAMAVSQPVKPAIYTSLPSEVPPEIRNGRTFVPVRVIAEQFGATVTWTAETRTLRVTQTDEADVQLTLGSRTVLVGART